MLITADGSIFHGSLIFGQILPNHSKAELICDQLLLFTILCVKLSVKNDMALQISFIAVKTIWNFLVSVLQAIP